MTTQPGTTRFHILYDFDRRKIDEEAACKALDCSPTTLKQVHTIWKPHLRQLVIMLDRLTVPTNTKNDQKKIKDKVAGLIGTSYRQVNRLLKTHEITLPGPISAEIRRETSEIAQNRRRMREKHALDVIAGLADVSSAAEAAGVSYRQIYRLIHKLCGSISVHYMDVKGLTLAQRRKIANQIEKNLI